MTYHQSSYFRLLSAFEKVIRGLPELHLSQLSIIFLYLSLGDTFLVRSLEFQWVPTVPPLSLFYSYESDFLDNMIRSGHRKLARSFNLCFRYIDDLIVFNNKKFWEYVKDIELNVEKTNQSDNLASYLDLTFTIEKDGTLSIKLYDKRDDFYFHIVNFPFLSSNIPSGPSYGVYISQLIRYARCCSYYDDFRHRHKMLVERLVSQRYQYERLRNSFKSFMADIKMSL